MPTQNKAIRHRDRRFLLRSRHEREYNHERKKAYGARFHEAILAFGCAGADKVGLPETGLPFDLEEKPQTIEVVPPREGRLHLENEEAFNLTH